MIIEIEDGSGFCFGVRNAIEKAECYLKDCNTLYCLGEIVHNEVEVNRLKNIGLQVIDKCDLKYISKSRMLIRAHGEPPSTYAMAKEQGIEVIDATCPIVLKLQSIILAGYEEMVDKGGNIVIYGKPGHAEVIGLEGQTKNTAIVINHPDDIEKIDVSRPIRLYSQTTQDAATYNIIAEKLKARMIDKQNSDNVDFIHYDTICKQVCNRSTQLHNFVKKFDLIFFVCSPKSSNGMVLYNLCKKNNPNTLRISDETEINFDRLYKINSVGICGATSTPLWLMQKVKNKIMDLQ